MSQAGLIDVVGGTPEIPTTFITDGVSAIPVLNELEILGGTGVNTAGSGNTVTVNIDSPVLVANGGTAQTSYVDGELLIGNSTGNTLTKATLTAGTGITITNTSGAITVSSSLAGGDVVGPAGATDNAIARYDTATGKLIQNSVVTIDDAGAVTGLTFASPLAETSGGTGTGTYTTGDILYASAANTLSKLAVGTNTHVLTLAAGIPSWAAPTVGTVTSVSGTASRITSSGGATPVIDIDAAYVGQASITTLGTITTGVWNGTDIPVSGGGTGASTLTGVLTGNGTSAITANAVTQYGTLVAGASNAVGSVAVGTAGQVFLSAGAGANPAMTDVTSAVLPIVAGATYNTLGEYNIATASSGVITGMAISDGGSGTIDIASGSIMVRTTSSDIGAIVSADYAGGTGIALTDASANFVYIEYNGGAPAISVTTVPNATPQDFVILGVVYRDGTDVHISAVNIPTGQVAQKLGRRLALVNGVTRQSGAVVGETGTNQVTVTAGVLWLALTTYATTAFDSSAASRWIGYYRDGVGGWTAQATQLTISNLLYDDNSGSLATLANNQYGVHWVYTSIDDDIYVVYGQNTYTLTEAENALTPATLPLQITSLHAILLAKIIIKKSASSFTEIQSSFDETFQPGLASDHQDLSGLQGGTTDEYNHLTAAEYVLIDGLTTLTDHGVVLGSGAAAISVTAAGTNGQVLLGSTGADCAFGTLTSSDSSITFTTGAGSLSIQGAAATASQAGVIELATDAETNTGTATDRAITPANITAWTGGTALVTVGTIATGVWNGTDIAVADGGTGASTLTGVLTGNGTGAITGAAVTQYGVLVGDASNAVTSTAVGTAGDVLTSGGAGVAPTYQTPTAGTVTSVSLIFQLHMSVKPPLRQ